LPTSCKEEEEIDKTLYHAPFDALFNISEVIFVNDLHISPLQEINSPSKVTQIAFLSSKAGNDGKGRKQVPSLI
jgi:hypothetical protein